MKIVLASSSPRRHQLLSEIDGLQVEVRPSNADESADGITSPSVLTMRLSERKAAAVFRPGEIVLGSDTVVALDNDILNKPATKAEAIEMLLRLSGKRHSVISGICIMTDEGTIYSYDRSIVEFVDFARADIIDYVNQGKSCDKAGGYGLQDEEIMRLTKSVQGSLTNIIGLPVELFLKILGERF